MERLSDRRVRERCVFFFNDTATTEIYTLSLHDALPISWRRAGRVRCRSVRCARDAVDAHKDASDATPGGADAADGDRKSTRLNSSHANISYAVFCLKKKSCSRPRITLLILPARPRRVNV